jgi:hypothetical protein
VKNVYFILALFLAMTTFGQNYTSAESVEYDPVNNRWLVSNGNRIITDDGTGNLGFFGIGSGSHGMEVLGNNVFVLDGNIVRGYDLTTEVSVMNLTITGASFLNGLTNDGVSILYATDFSGRRIYSIDVSDISNPIFIEIVSNTSDTPNGVYFDGDNNRLIYVTWGGSAKIKAVDLSNFEQTTLVNTTLGNIDGIDNDSSGNYFISSWSPTRITKYTNDFSSSEIITTDPINNPADIGINEATNVLAIPIGNDVVFKQLTVLGINDFSADISSTITLSENPITENSFIELNLLRADKVQLEIYNTLGQKVSTLENSHLKSGLHIYTISSENLNQGVYFIHLTNGRKATTRKFIVQ